MGGRRAWWLDWGVVLVLAVCGLFGSVRSASAQIGALVSPGRLSRAHSSLEGITSCLSCHTAGQGVTPAKCLTCHKPVAERIAQKKGVHRNVRNDCVACHVEHAGVDGELRPFDQRRFDHAAEAGFPLDGLHQPIAGTCATCHKGRSFLTAKAECASCHTDAHKGSLGTQCATCHTTAVKFAETRQRFDHGRTEFPLTGRHAGVACASCHKTSTYRNVAFASCANCHADPHAQPMGGTCASCHTTQGWRSARIDHSKTRFPLKGLHASVDCVRCHVQPAAKVKPAFGTCATCHADPHKGSFKQDCAACHTEAGFKTGIFDHSTTKFPLVDKHAGLACAACHKGQGAVAAPTLATTRGVGAPGSAAQPAGRPAPARGAASPAAPGRTGGRSNARPVAARGGTGAVAAVGAADFRGLSTACASCHEDVHQAELGTSCEKCHSAKTFEVGVFSHARPRAFFDGQHAALRCVQCHVPAGATVTQTAAITRQAPGPAAATAMNRGATSTGRMAHVGLGRTPDTCLNCHADVHLGQLGPRCETCHSVETAKFEVKAFAHDKTAFPLKGKHAPLACEACHKVEARAFPAGTGTARHFTGLGTACASCHRDPHEGQLQQNCDRCHTVDTFTVKRYTHLRARTLTDFFRGPHLSATCAACHKPIAVRAGQPVQWSYRTPTTCTTCHADVHKGALGPRCENCHKL